MSRIAAFICFFFAAASPLQAASPKIAIIGLDGADWAALDPLISAGRLPELGSFRTHGASGVTIASLPLLSPLIWTTIATGRTPDEHGVLDFVAFDSDGRRRPVSSYERKCRALWNIFSENGRTVGVYGWWATWPAEKVNGEIVSNLLFENLPLLHDLAAGRNADASELAYPASLAPMIKLTPVSPAELASVAGVKQAEAEAELARKTEKPFESRLQHLARIIQTTRAVSDTVVSRLAAGQPDLLMVYFEGPDMVQHLYHAQPGGEQVVGRYYESLDAMLTALRRRLSPDTIIIVCSDHGFLLAGESGGEGQPDDFYTTASSYHRRYGIFGAAGPGMTARRLDAATIDITPTVLAAAGLPVASDLPGRALALGGARPVVTRVPTFETTPRQRVPPALVTGDSIEALQALGYVISDSPTYSANLARVLLEKGDLTGAAKAVESALKVAPGRESVLYDLYDLRRLQGDPSGIIDASRQFAALPGPMKPDVAVAAIKAASESAVTDVTALAKELAGSESPALLNLLLGVTHAGNADFEAASREIQTAVEQDPELVQIAVPELTALFAHWNAAAGLKAIEAILGRHPIDPHVAAACRARLLAAAGRPAEALAAYTAAFDAAPDNIDLMFEAARELYRMHDASGARRVYDRIIELKPDLDAALLGAGAAAAAAGDSQAAILYIERAHYERNPSALNALALAYGKIGRRDRAAELLQKSLALDPAQKEIAELLERMR